MLFFPKQIQIVIEHLDTNNQHVKEVSSRRYALVILNRKYSLAVM